MTKADFGLTGDTITSSSPSYVSGGCYPIPSSGETKCFGRGIGGVWTIEKYTKGNGGAATTEILKTSPLKLSRPLGILNQGPFNVLASELRSYVGYNQFDSDVIGI